MDGENFKTEELRDEILVPVAFDKLKPIEVDHNERNITVNRRRN